MLPVHLLFNNTWLHDLVTVQAYFHLLMVTISFNLNIGFPLQFACEGGLPLISVTLQVVEIDPADLVSGEI